MIIRAVHSSDSTRWTIIRGASEGDALDRAEFVRRYASVIRSYLQARWRAGPLLGEIDDAAQEVFVACFEPDGPLTRADPLRPGGFRAYLYGIVRNVARGIERQRGKGRELPPGAGIEFAAVPAREESLSKVFDRAWAVSLLRLAAEGQQAAARGDERAERRVEMLHLRFHDDLPIRTIAERWGVEAAFLHEEYRTARREFLTALRAVVRDHHGGPSAGIDAECARLLDHLGRKSP